MTTRPGPHVGCVLPFHRIGCPDWKPGNESWPEDDLPFTAPQHDQHEDGYEAAMATARRWESRKPVPWGEHPHGCDCGDCP